MKIFDSHCHINSEQYEGKEDEVIKMAVEEYDVHYMGVVGTDAESIPWALRLAKQYPNNLLAVIGWHPNDAADYGEDEDLQLRKWAELPYVKAIGEIGLDYHWMSNPKEVQKEVFIRQIQVAKDHDLPISIHTRDATEDTYKVLKEVGLPERGGIMHCFSGSVEEAEMFLDLGMYISISGVVTFKNAPELREVAKMVPSDKLLIETDSPYLTPEPNRGKLNYPAYVRYTAEKVAELRNVTLEEIAKITTENAMRAYNWRPADE